MNYKDHKKSKLTGEESFGKWIDIISRHTNFYLNKRLDKYNLNKGESKFLIQLYLKEGICQEDLVNILKTDKHEVAKGVKKLVNEGFITKEKDKDDRRINRLYLSEKSKNIKDEIISMLKDTSNILSKGFTAEEKELLYDFLIRMAENMFEESSKLKSTN